LSGEAQRPALCPVRSTFVERAEPTLADEGGIDLAAEAGELARIEDGLAAVEAALSGLDDGTYGTCGICGAEIPPDVLARTPHRRACEAHAD
jgi:RNA polymerase-binding transcription factor DksA